MKEMKKYLKLILLSAAVFMAAITIPTKVVKAEDPGNCLVFTAEEDGATVKFNWCSGSVQYWKSGMLDYNNYSPDDLITLTK